MPYDQFYSSESIATDLLRFRRSRFRVKLVADFAAGEGALLLSAREIFPSATLLGNDLCKKNVRILKRIGIDFVSNCDFRQNVSIDRSRTLTSAREVCDLVLLNPPFTNKGGFGFSVVDSEGQILRCSAACLFVYNSLGFLSRKGELLAVLPEGALFSERDKEFWRALSRDYDVAFERIANGSRPASWNSEVYYVSVVKRTEKGRRRTLTRFPRSMTLDEIKVGLIRGNVNVARKECINGHGFKLIHTTDVRSDKIEIKTLDRYSKSSRVIRAPAVILSRVCNPKSMKVAYLGGRGQYNISDCLYALEVDSAKDGKRLSKEIRDNWEDFSNLYKGTGAKHLTIENLKGYLLKCRCLVR